MGGEETALQWSMLIFDVVQFSDGRPERFVAEGRVIFLAGSSLGVDPISCVSICDSSGPRTSYRAHSIPQANCFCRASEGLNWKWKDHYLWGL